MGPQGLRRQSLGVGLVVLSTVAIAIVPSLAKLAYDGGSNTLSVITGRSVFSVAITLLLLAALGLPLRASRRPALLGLATGVGYAATLYGYLGAVNYLPVNIVILIYFTHPLFVGVVAALLGQERLSAISIAALAAAVIGLTLAVGFSAGTLDPWGLALATMAMITTVAVILGNASAMREAPAVTVGFYMMLSAAVVLSIAFALFGDLALPVTPLSWLGFAGVAIAATAGTLSFMGGMAIIGSTRAAMITNLEPVLGVIFALGVLGERVTWLQGIGIATVIGSIIVMERWR